MADIEHTCLSRKCKACGTPVGKGKQYCEPCRKQARNRYVKAPVRVNQCANCGKEYTTNLSKSKFCCIPCQKEFWLKNNLEIYQESKRKYEERKSHLVKKERRENLFFRRKKFYEIEFKQCQNCGAGFVDRSAKLNVQLCRCCKYKNSSEQVRAINLSKSVNRGRSRACKSCGVLFSPLYGFGKELRSTCSDECNKLDKKKYKEEYKKTEVYKSIRARNRHIRRIRKRNNSSSACAVDKFTRIEIFERDKWVCKLCGKKVDKSLKHNQLMSATLDHIVPIAEGGSHTRANVQLAHMICNSNKGRGSIKHEQLLLIG